MSAPTVERVLWAGWICTGRYMGKCHACGTFLRVECEPRQQHETSALCECGTRTFIKQVMGSIVEEKKCDRRCTNARGHDCECSCGGHNHGAER